MTFMNPRAIAHSLGFIILLAPLLAKAAGPPGGIDVEVTNTPVNPVPVSVQNPVSPPASITINNDEDSPVPVKSEPRSIPFGNVLEWADRGVTSATGSFIRAFDVDAILIHSLYLSTFAESGTICRIELFMSQAFAIPDIADRKSLAVVNAGASSSSFDQTYATPIRLDIDPAKLLRIEVRHEVDGPGLCYFSFGGLIEETTGSSS